MDKLQGLILVCTIDNDKAVNGINRGWWYKLEEIRRIEGKVSYRNGSYNLGEIDNNYVVKVSNSESGEFINAWLDYRDFFIAATNMPLCDYIIKK